MLAVDGGEGGGGGRGRGGVGGGGGGTFGFWSVRQAVKVLGGARRGAATRSCACG